MIKRLNLQNILIVKKYIIPMLMKNMRKWQESIKNIRGNNSNIILMSNSNGIRK